MATHYLSEMREVHPGGPWRLAGYCFGTIVAFEMAQRLSAAGETVELVAMFNGPSPAWIRQWGWFGNQPGWRAKHAMPPAPNARQRWAKRRRRKLMRLVGMLARAPLAIVQPRRILSGIAWHTRKQRASLMFRFGKPLSEQMREQYFIEMHLVAERAYDPKRYPGELLVFYSESLYEDPTLGWDGFAREIQTFAVPGEHDNNRQAMFEPAVAFVAERLRDALSRSVGQP
jgi:thioesterase domain-containing protein